MGGLNSLSGLNNVNVDFRPTIESVQPNKTGQAPALMPELEVKAPQPEAQQPTANSMVRELDVLLLNAATKSVSSDAAANVTRVGDKLVEKGLITKKEKQNLESLANKASESLKALDKFSGRELASALMTDKTGALAWKSGFFGMNSVAKAVKTAIDSQLALSEALAKFNDSLASAPDDVVDPALQDRYTELQFQCDRRATEINSIVVRMFDLVQKEVVDGASSDPQVKSLLNATFKELIPREAIMMHGTAEAMEMMKAKLGEQMKPLAEMLDAFKADSGKVLGQNELASLKKAMFTMQNALDNVRKNGLEVEGGRIDVDKSLLKHMEIALGEADRMIMDAKKLSATRARSSFLRELVNSLAPELQPGGQKVMASLSMGHPLISALKDARQDLATTLRSFGSGKEPMDKFDATVDACIMRCIKKFSAVGDVEAALTSVGFEAGVARQAAKTIDGLNVVKAQFKELMRTTEAMINDPNGTGLAGSDVRRIMLGESGISGLVEAKAHGFSVEEVDPATDSANIVNSRALGSGAAGKTYLLTTKSGEEVVFKPELDGRLGLDELTLGRGKAYTSTQNVANLNLATQNTAKAFGCDDVIVKYSVGNHDGQFGIFMEKAKGHTGGEFARKVAKGDDGLSPAELRSIPDKAEREKIHGQLAQKLNKLMWLDLITGQGDRHRGNYFVHIDRTTHEVSVKGIDNDASFSATRTGLQRFTFDKSGAADFDEELLAVCKKLHPKDWQTEFNRRVANDPGIKRQTDGTLTVDLSKAKSPEIAMAIPQATGAQSFALPEEIDKAFFDKLVAMKPGMPARKEFLDSIAPKVSPEALKATETRLDEAIEHAEKLNTQGKVLNDAQWKEPVNIFSMLEVRPTAEITKSDGSIVTVGSNIKCVKDYSTRICPSYYKRDNFQELFM